MSVVLFDLGSLASSTPIAPPSYLSLPLLGTDELNTCRAESIDRAGRDCGVAAGTVSRISVFGSSSPEHSTLEPRILHAS